MRDSQIDNRRRVIVYYKDEEKQGFFLGFGVDNYNEYGNYTAAIVEFDDGTVDLIRLSNMRFINVNVPTNS